MNIKSPCYLCEDRKVGCHGKCEAYLKFKAKRDEINRKRYEQSDFQTYEINAIIKRRKRSRNMK